jgi:hydroxymethylpyrimidine pyrophosphatase-like HAD family hydrolase
MIVMFDISGTVLGAWDGSFRPGIVDTIQSLKNKGHRVCFWTGGFVGDYIKPLSSIGVSFDEIFSKYNRLPFTPDIYIDDSPHFCSDWMIIVGPHYSKEISGHPIDIEDIMSLASIKSYEEQKEYA